MSSMSHVDEQIYIFEEYTDDKKFEIVKHEERIIEAVEEEYKKLMINVLSSKTNDIFINNNRNLNLYRY